MNNDLEQFSEKRLQILADYSCSNATIEWGEIEALARIALAAKQAKPIGEIRLSEYRSDGTREASVVCLHDQADWDNFTDGTLLYLNPQPAHPEQVIPDGWKLVPVEPTYEMKKHYYDSSVAPISKLSVTGYRAMLAAAPKPESE